MLKEIKLQARKIVFKNYKYFVLPILFYSISSSIVTAVFNLGFTQSNTVKINILTSSFWVLLWFLIKLVVIPFITVILCKISISAIEGKLNLNIGIKAFLCKKVFIKVFLINMIPMLFDIVKDMVAYSGDIYFSHIKEYSIFELVFSALVIWIGYKFFMCNYLFINEDLTVKENIQKSFNTMKSRFFKYIWYEFSFFGWDILMLIELMLIMLLAKTVGINYTYCRLLMPFGFGVTLFYQPYKAVTDILYIKKILEHK